MGVMRPRVSQHPQGRASGQSGRDRKRAGRPAGTVCPPSTRHMAASPVQWGQCASHGRGGTAPFRGSAWPRCVPRGLDPHGRRPQADQSPSLGGQPGPGQALRPRPRVLGPATSSFVSSSGDTGRGSLSNSGLSGRRLGRPGTLGHVCRLPWRLSLGALASGGGGQGGR